MHPFEYQDFDDFPHRALDGVLEDYEHFALPIVQLFENPQEIRRDIEDRVIKDDAIQFWESFSPESLSSNCGGQLFRPRPQGFEALEEFLELFGQQ